MGAVIRPFDPGDAPAFVPEFQVVWRGDGERRVTFLIEPTHVMVMGG